MIDDAIALIFKEAFNPTAIGVGSIIGVLLVGFKRAAFSNEAGAGSASIAHSAVKTKYSASEGLVALLEPFIDTVVICTMTALVIIIYNFDGAFQYGGEGGIVYIDGKGYEGAGITAQAFAQYIPFSKIFLAIVVFLFAISTMISWSYYGLQSWKFIFGRGKRADLLYKLLFLIFIVIGAASSMKSIWDFSDAMIFAMIFPNMIGLFFLFPEVRKELIKYLKAIKNSMILKEKIDQCIRTFEDFPKKGINFKDITSLLLQHQLSSEIIDEFIYRIDVDKIDAVVGIESRGFLFGFLLANKIQVPFIPIRKAGKLPGEKNKILL